MNKYSSYRSEMVSTDGRTDTERYNIIPRHESVAGYKKLCVNYFLMRNPYMKFQNCILINFVTDARTDKLKAICTFNFSKVGGIINEKPSNAYNHMNCTKYETCATLHRFHIFNISLCNISLM